MSKLIKLCIYVHFIICQLYLNKAVQKKKKKVYCPHCFCLISY